MSNVKFRIGSGQLDPGTISFEVQSKEGTGLVEGMISNIYLDGENERYTLLLNELCEPVNGDRVYLTSDGLNIYTNLNRINCGNNDIRNGISQFAFGNELKSSYNNQFIIGNYNANNSDSVVEIGNGTNDKNRSNLLRITDSGRIYLGSAAEDEYSYYGKNELYFYKKGENYSEYVNDYQYLHITPDKITYFNFEEGYTLTRDRLSFDLGLGYWVDGIYYNRGQQGSEVKLLIDSDITLDATGSSDSMVSIKANSQIDMNSQGKFTLICLDKYHQESSSVYIQANNQIDMKSFGNFNLICTGEYNQEAAGIIVAESTNDTTPASLLLKASIPGQSSGIMITSNKIQFNCDKNNIVDENNEPLFKNNTLTATFGDEKDIPCQLILNTSNADHCLINNNIKIPLYDLDGNVIKENIGISTAIKIIDESNIQVDNYLYSVISSDFKTLYRYDYENNIFTRVLQVEPYHTTQSNTQYDHIIAYDANYILTVSYSDTNETNSCRISSYKFTQDGKIESDVATREMNLYAGNTGMRAFFWNENTKQPFTCVHCPDFVILYNAKTIYAVIHKETANASFNTSNTSLRNGFPFGAWYYWLPIATSTLCSGTAMRNYMYGFDVNYIAGAIYQISYTAGSTSLTFTSTGSPGASSFFPDTIQSINYNYDASGKHLYPCNKINKIYFSQHGKNDIISYTFGLVLPDDNTRGIFGTSDSWTYSSDKTMSINKKASKMAGDLMSHSGYYFQSATDLVLLSHSLLQKYNQYANYKNRILNVELDMFDGSNINSFFVKKDNVIQGIDGQYMQGYLANVIRLDQQNLTK